MTEPPPWLGALESSLKAGAARPESRYVQLANVRPDGRPANRTVVFRVFSGSSARLVFTTDARSEKAADLRLDPRVELCWSFPETREQFRVLGLARVETDPAAADRRRIWDGLSGPSRASFAWPRPGAPRSPDAAFRGQPPDSPPPSFALLIVSAERVDHLDLRPDPHARTVHELRPGTGWSSEPVNP